MKKITVIGFIFCLLIVSAVSFAGCCRTDFGLHEMRETGGQITSTKDAHFFRVGFDLANVPHELFAGDIEDITPVLIRKRENLLALLGETYSRDWCQKTFTPIRDNRFTNLIESYSDNFFEHSQLVVFVASARTGGIFFIFNGITVEGNTWTIELSQNVSGPFAGQVITRWLGIVEINHMPAGTFLEVKVLGQQ